MKPSHVALVLLIGGIALLGIGQINFGFILLTMFCLAAGTAFILASAIMSIYALYLHFSAQKASHALREH